MRAVFSPKNNPRVIIIQKYMENFLIKMTKSLFQNIVLKNLLKT